MLFRFSAFYRYQQRRYTGYFEATIVVKAETEDAAREAARQAFAKNFTRDTALLSLALIGAGAHAFVIGSPRLTTKAEATAQGVCSEPIAYGRF